MSSEMDSFRNRITALRCQNNERRFFIPRNDLYAELTLDVVHDILKVENIEKESLDELTRSIVQGKRAVLGILVCIRSVKSILEFVKVDGFQNQPMHLDHRLPFSAEHLKKILPISVAEEFHEKQWEFVAPTFSRNTLPRCLEEDVVLPIVQETLIGHGGFGTVYRTLLHPGNHEFSHESGWMVRDRSIGSVNLADSVFLKCVRKEFIPHANHESDYEAELRNLSILNHLKHPNIIEVLSAFTYRAKHNLIFPALSGDLAGLMERERPPEFALDETFIIALSKLASAIEDVHNLTANTIDLQQIGCHHDLRPRNILVDGDRFVLADFGLSRFKSPSQDSTTKHKKGQGDYVAPECEDIDDNFDKHTIGRASDIWSFGCIIIEIVTYMIRGHEGVEDFWKVRSHKVGQIRYHLFHHGPDTLSTAVHDWLAGLASGSTKTIRLLLQLAKAMLSLQPSQRPVASVVAARLRLVAIYATTESIDEKYDELYDTFHDTDTAVEVYIQRARYSSWKEACGVNQTEDLGLLAEGFKLDLDVALGYLAQIKQELISVLSMEDESRYHLFLPLRHLNNRLTSLLPVTLNQSMQIHLERKVVAETEDPAILKGAQTTFEQNSDTTHIAEMASIKRMTHLLDIHKGQKRPDLFLDLQRVTEGISLGDCTIGEIKGINSAKSRTVLIEWMCYETELVDEEEGKNRIYRLDGIADFLNSTAKPPALRALHCSNYFHEPKKRRFGLVFDFPSLSPTNGSQRALEAITLRQLIESTGGRRRYPFLGDVFKLAHTLAKAVAELHKVGWLHKSISSFHVVFFSEAGAQSSRSLPLPYIIGVNHSRPEDEMEWTAGPPDREETAYLDFQHPEYLKFPQRYRAEFDYYSLGLVLLEIALWNPLSTITKDWMGAPDKVRDRLLADVVPGLCRTVGARYFQVVDACLRGNLASSEKKSWSRGEASDKSSRHRTFEDLVVRQLARCSA